MQEETAARPTLVRREQDKILGGVASGIAHHFGWDATVVRLAFIVAFALGGSGFLAYVLAWIFIPGDQGGSETMRSRIDRLPGWVLPAGAVVLFLAVVSDMDWDHPGPYLALALFAFAALLLRDGDPRPAPSQSAASAAETRAAESTAAAPAARRESSPLGLYTVGIALLAVGVAAIGDRAGWFDMDLGRYLAAGLVIVGGGLVVGAWRGRGRALIPLGLLLLPLVIVAGTLSVPLEGYVGDRHFAPVGEMVDTDYEMLAGATVVDLTAASGANNPALDISMAFGEFEILVPSDWRIDFTGELQGGEFFFLGEDHEGISIDLERSSGPSTADESITIDVQAGFGQVTVRQTGVTP